jgi:indolepyruvate ferredoxin oxidoreductase
MSDTATPSGHVSTSPPQGGSAAFSLQDRYTAEDGQVLVTGIQALVRLPLDQMRIDRARGLRTGAFISGYQGSPLGGYDRELISNKAMNDAFGIEHWPGTNEELAATAVAGSQLVAHRPDARVDGVAGYWYGKAPGLERAADAIRHGVFAGTSARGGVLALIGDDPACKSSTVPSRSDALVAALGFPFLDPGTMQDILDLGLHGIEMSRASGLWTGLKIVTAIADGSAQANVDLARFRPVIPSFEVDGAPFTPTLSGFLLAPVSVAQEAEVFGPRIEMATRYVAENAINVETISSSNAWLTIVASGYTAELVLAALRVLGLDATQAAELGIRVLKLRAIHPFDEAAIRRSATGVGTVLVVEEKRGYIESLVRDALYGVADRPRVIGKLDHDGQPLVPLVGALTVEAITEPLRRVLRTAISEERLAPLRRKVPLALQIRPEAVRTPYFCSGCPHNTSTVVPEGSLVGIGIGCHGMVNSVGHENRGEFISITQMGGEGMHWVGMAPFVNTPHVFQNIGDGTFFHSGQLAIQAAIASGVTITYKLLYNAAVAMTGGQDATGQLAVPQVAAKLMAEGVKQVIITTDETDKYRGVDLTSGVSVRHRDQLLDAQEHLRAIPGVTVLIHDQQCAAEKRRDRKRGLLPTPTTRVIIDHRVCEGCGDCGVQSNCLSLEPFETDWGRKTRIDQGSCNLDRSCIKGDCPAFVTVTPASNTAGATQNRVASSYGPLPDPVLIVPRDGSVMRIPGIGGTGVVTVSQLLLAAAKIDGVEATAIDQTGLSQKAGPVVSTVTFGQPVPGRVHVLMACDLLTSVSPANIEGLDASWSHIVGSTTITPTGRMVGKVATAHVDVDSYRTALASRSLDTNNLWPQAGRLAIGLLGSGVSTNVLLMGVAFQAGMIPLSAAAIERAIELNGVAVQANRDAFRWGRRWALDPAGVEAQAFLGDLPTADVSGLDDVGLGDTPDELISLVGRRRDDLRAYQDDAYARRYVEFVRRTATAERSAGGDGSFTTTVAHQLARLMAYKDEYEVARLLADGKTRAEQALGRPIESMTFHLHPPTLRAMGMQRKLNMNSWTHPSLTALAAMKKVRGTKLDLFGRAELRKTERALIDEFRSLIESLLPRLATDHAEATRIAGLIDVVRGFEHVKERNIATYRSELATALASHKD